MLKRGKNGARRTVELEVSGERIRAATWPLSKHQEGAVVVGSLAIEELRAVGIWDAECEADAAAGEDAAALAALWGERLPLRERLQEIRLLILGHFLIERRAANGERLPCDAASIRTLSTKRRHDLAIAILADLDAKRARRNG